MASTSSRAAAAALLLAIAFTSQPLWAQGHISEIQVNLISHHGMTRPLRQIPPGLVRDQDREIPIRAGLFSGGPPQRDSVVQGSTSGFASTLAGIGFPGVGQGDYGYTVKAAPPDTNGSVGATQYVQWVNLSFAVFDKATGNLVYGPAAGNTLWQGSDLTACATNNDGDPIALYDKGANRWVMTQLSFTGGPPFYLCIAVSATSDATGSWYLYALQWTSNTLPDYPKIAAWPDAYYISANMFYGGFFFLGAQACALQRDAMLNNLDAGVQCFTQTFQPSLLPSDLDGSNPPPAGSPNFYLNLGSNALNLWRFHVDWANPANTTMAGPISLPVAAFNNACGGRTCIPQPGTTQQLDSIGERLMYRLAYRNFGDHEALVATHSVAPFGNRRNPSGAGVRWYEIRNPNGSPAVFQQGTFAPDSNFRWMGSIAMDKTGDIALGYSVSSSGVHPSIRYTGRTPADPLNTLQAETSVLAGAGSQIGLSRWGDYSAMSIDPVDDCTFYYTTEYLKADGKFNWSTWITTFKFPGCQ